jgi:hypothetical protein
MKYTNKLKMAMIATNINQVKLAKLTNQSQQNLSQKIVNNSYRIQEYERLVNALGCQLKINIILPNGETV